MLRGSRVACVLVGCRVLLVVWSQVVRFKVNAYLDPQSMQNNSLFRGFGPLFYLLSSRV